MPSRIRRWLSWRRHGLQRRRLVSRHTLCYLFFEVTRRCNLRCAYCGSGCDPEVVRGELPASRWIEIAREIAGDFSSSEVMIGITGGEPLLKEGIHDLTAELGRLGFGFGMVTNGTRLDDDAARWIEASGMGSISLSFDAPPPLGDELRGRGVAARVEDAIDSLRRAGYHGVLEICTTLTRPVVPLLARVRDHVASLGVRRWRLLPVIPIGRATERPDLLLGADDLRSALDYVKEARTDARSPRPEFAEECYLGDAYEGEVRPYLFGCQAGVTVAGILSDGRIGACPELPDGFVQGDILHERFLHVWDTRYQVFRDRSWTMRGECASCDAYSRCRGGSLHLYPRPGEDFLRCTYLDLGGKLSTRTSTPAPHVEASATTASGCPPNATVTLRSAPRPPGVSNGAGPRRPGAR